MVYERVFRNRLPDMGRNIEGLGNAYDLQWDGAPTCADPLSATVPTIDHAIYLINAVKFHCAQLFHVFDEDTFMPALYTFYENPSDRNTTDKVWLVHFMVILAFGKGFTVNKNGKDPPGVEYFIQALQMLPNMIMLWRYPVHSVEVLTCIALYLSCLDYRIVAHNFMGQAMRLALNYGLHTNIKADRFGSSVTRISALKMQLKLSQLIADINRSKLCQNSPAVLSNLY
ncbi:putative zn 2cys6 transcription factor [Diaporthe ampelina]|uniref:Putative zn 2cys6 transcription factor n=1 Tax=Diaporthe ampelina TaxID=1214573 RepID=A0A0G2FU25_9PEZI|nr:putative zn 2cys6 transcription factor [Diaporthe ampelina]